MKKYWRYRPMQSDFRMATKNQARIRKMVNKRGKGWSSKIFSFLMLTQTWKIVNEILIYVEELEADLQHTKNKLENLEQSWCKKSMKEDKS